MAGGGDKKTQKPTPWQCLPLPLYQLSTAATQLQWARGERSWGGKKLVRARKKDKKVGLGLSPYLPGHLSGSTTHPSTRAKKTGAPKWSLYYGNK